MMLDSVKSLLNGVKMRGEASRRRPSPSHAPAPTIRRRTDERDRREHESAGLRALWRRRSLGARGLDGRMRPRRGGGGSGPGKRSGSWRRGYRRAARRERIVRRGGERGLARVDRGERLGWRLLVGRG